MIKPNFPLTIVCFWILSPKNTEPIVIYDAHTTSREFFTLNDTMILEREDSGTKTTYTTSGMSISDFGWVALGITIDYSTITYHFKKQGGTAYEYEQPVTSKTFLFSGHLHLISESGSSISRDIVINQIFITSPLSLLEFSSLLTTYGFDSLTSPFLPQANYITYFLPDVSGQTVPDSGDTASRDAMMGFTTSTDSRDPTYLGDEGLEFNEDRVLTIDCLTLPRTKGVSMWANIPCGVEQSMYLYGQYSYSTDYTIVEFTTDSVYFRNVISYSSFSLSTMGTLATFCNRWSFFYIGILALGTTTSRGIVRLNTVSKIFVQTHDEWISRSTRIYFGYPVQGKIRFYQIISNPPLQSSPSAFYLYRTVDSLMYTYCEPNQYMTLYGGCVSCATTYYFPDLANRCCTHCPDYCVTCTNLSYCISCGTNAFFNVTESSTLCFSPCPDGFFGNTVTGYCEACLNHCDDCTNTTACVLCFEDYYYYTNSSAYCLDTCPVFYYQNETYRTCRNCVDYCQSCTNETDCGECFLGYYPNEVEAGVTSCELCVDNCYTCTSGTTCDQCNSTYYLFSAVTPYSCLTECPDYYFETASYTCDSCVPYCRNCTTATNCQLCADGYYLDTLSDGTQQCINPCRDGYFNDENSVCQSCLAYCKVCTNYTRCVECFDPYFRKTDNDTLTDTCVEDCGLKYYSVSTQRVCIDCDFRCLTCSDSTNQNCPDCDFTYEGVTRTGSTACTCGAGYIVNITSRECERCTDLLCESCSAYNLSECYSCSSSNSKIIHDSGTMSCVCTAGYFRNEVSCLGCNSLCTECTGPESNQCKSGKCSSNAYPIETIPTTCLYMCKNAENNLYLDIDEKVCKNCIYPCKECFADNTDSCTSCQEGYILMESTCIKGCPTKYYNDSNVCLPCNERCTDCEDRTNYCIDGCESPYLYLNHQCLESCGIGYTGVDGYCETCDSGCQICYTDSDNATKVCAKCSTNRYLYQGVCTSVCPVGRYGDVTTGNCELCSEACTTCTNGTYKDCITCNSALGYIKIADTTCTFPACIEGKYFNRTLIKCTACATGCTTCENSTLCSSCDKGYSLQTATNGQICIDDCDKVGFKRDSATYECKEICGDGRNMGELECDDGNQVNGDGCDSSCKVEDYYTCSGGDSTHADTCVETKKPYVVKIKYYYNRSVVVTFNEIISVKSPLADIISMSLDNAEDTTVSWSYQSCNLLYTRRLIFDLSYNHSLSGSEELVISVNNVSKVLDLNGNELRDSEFRVEVIKYTYVSQSDQDTAEAAGSASLYAMLPSLALSLGLSLVFNTPIEGMWATISVIQMMSYLTLVDLKYPSILEIFFDCIESVHNFNKWLPNPFSYILDNSTLNMEPYSEQFNSRGFESRQMIFLCGSDLCLLALTTLVIFALIPLSHVCTIFNTLLEKLRWGSVVRSFIQAYLKICLAIFVNIGVLSFKNWQSCLSSMLTIVIGSVMICLPAFISDFLFLNFESAKTDPNFKKRHGSYISGFRVKANLLNLMYYPIFLFRRVILSATLVILFDYPQLQLAFSFLGCLSMLFYLIYWRPFGNKYSFYAAVNSEILFGIVNLLLYAFYNGRVNESKSTTFGWVIISLTILSLCISWGCMIIQQIRSWLKRRSQAAQETKDPLPSQLPPSEQSLRNHSVSSPRIDHSEGEKKEQSQGCWGTLSRRE